MKCCLLICSEWVIVLFNWVICQRFLILVDLILEMIKKGLSLGAFYYLCVIDYAFSSVHMVLAPTAPSAPPLWCLWRGSIPVSPCLVDIHRRFTVYIGVFFNTELLLHCTAGMCVNWNKARDLCAHAHPTC